MKSKPIGSDFDDFLREEDLLEDAEATAAKRVIAFVRPPSPGMNAWATKAAPGKPASRRSP
jgi:hypothetical protein